MKNAMGDEIKMEPGYCLWCSQWVTSQQESAGAIHPEDPCWATEGGDFGCSLSPETCEEGCGAHARPYDLAIRLMMEDRFPVRDWLYEVANGDTKLGFNDWLLVKIEQEESNNE